MPKLFKTKVEKSAEKYTIEYLNNMYGDGNFEVTNIQNAYHFYTFNDVRWEGFQIDLKSSYIYHK